MDGLRWLLLLFGVLVVAGVYFYSRYQREQAAKPAPETEDPVRLEPSLTDDPDGDDLPVLMPEDDFEASTDPGDVDPEAGRRGGDRAGRLEVGR